MTNPNTGKVPLTVWVDPPPDGKEWHLTDTDTYQEGRYKVAGWHLRPIVSATVMVEMTREDATMWSEGILTNAGLDRLKPAARAALARKPEALCRDCQYPEEAHSAGDRARLDFNVCRRFTLERKPCPVMVCGLRQTACYSDEPDRCLDRRPCKLAEGHGGEHE